MPTARTQSKYLNSGGMRLVKQLFIEFDNDGENDLAVYSFSREDKEVNGTLYPSLYLLYMLEKDITEARFVENYLYDWQQWEQIAKSHFLKDEIARWRVDLKAKVMGELVDTLILDAHSDSRSSKSSAKYLVDKLSKNAKGKPATAVIPTTDEDTKKLTTEVAQDFKRLGIQVN